MSRLRAAVVGIRGIGRRHAQVVAGLEEYKLVALADLDEALVGEAAAEYGARPVHDFGAMLREERPDVVVISTPNASHARLTLEAVEAGVRGVYCEKPMAVNLGDAQALVAACEARGVQLAVNHQRRTLPPFRSMRRLIQEGAIGRVETIRASCAGDFLTDGTHLVDTVRHLLDDAPAKWVFAQVGREHKESRYGHAVEDGALALVEFADGTQAEFRTGAMQRKGGRYQDFEVIGSEGRLWRAGDSAAIPVVIQDVDGGWRQVPLDDGPGAEENLRLFARNVIAGGGEHPLSGRSGLADQEIVMAVFESARLRARVDLPLSQLRYPLDLLIEEGAL